MTLVPTTYQLLRPVAYGWRGSSLVSFSLGPESDVSIFVVEITSALLGISFSLTNVCSFVRTSTMWFIHGKVYKLTSIAAPVFTVLDGSKISDEANAIRGDAQTLRYISYSHSMITVTNTEKEFWGLGWEVTSYAAILACTVEVYVGIRILISDDTIETTIQSPRSIINNENLRVPRNKQKYHMR